ncbi:MAG TPA: IS1595 family transposase [Thermoleophilaceae bacterium]|nr:IS1595 family transposase [Thermoleophilaceae bacterium]
MSQVDRNSPKRGPASASRCSIMEFMEAFPDDATCLDFLWRQRYSEDGRHVDCPKCGEDQPFHRVKSRPSYCCGYCGHHIHPTAGTIFHRSATSLRLWFYAMYIMTSTKCGVSAKRLERELGVTYKTAWRMANRIRNELMTQDDDVTLSGEVEVDETYVGGKQRRQFGRPGRTSKKTPVMAMAQRGGKVVPDASARSLLPEIERHVEPGTQVYTDEWRGYASLHKLGYPHGMVRHGHHEYVRGPVFTSTVEGLARRPLDLR